MVLGFFLEYPKQDPLRLQSPSKSSISAFASDFKMIPKKCFKIFLASVSGVWQGLLTLQGMAEHARETI